MKIHLTAVGGSIMHALAINLKLLGHEVSGSDDQIFEPAKSNLKQHGLLPEKLGWQANLIDEKIDILIAGMHAKENNPEILAAIKHNVKILSFPEFVYQHSSQKKRIVIAGSHGKTTITAMLMHAFRKKSIDFDYLAGAKVEGFKQNIRLTENAKWILIEGDEYLSSALDPKPKFLWYKPDIALITGIAWDHINVFPTSEDYFEQFRQFLSTLNGKTLVFYEGDNMLEDLVKTDSGKIKELIPYNTPDFYLSADGSVNLVEGEAEFKLNVFGRHNLQNLNGAAKVAIASGLFTKNEFFEAMADFKGAGKRLEKLQYKDGFYYRDFAHAPSKVKATADAVAEFHPESKVFACLELHTFSSLNKSFLPGYANSLKKADVAVIYLANEVLKLKNMPEISEKELRDFFNRKDLILVQNTKDLSSIIKQQFKENKDMLGLFMSSGNFGGLDIQALLE